MTTPADTPPPRRKDSFTRMIDCAPLQNHTIEMNIIGVKPDTLDEPGPPLFDPNDPKRTVIEEILVLEKDGFSISVSTCLLIKYHLVKSDLEKVLIGLKVELCLGILEDNKSLNRRLDNKRRFISQIALGNNENFIEGEVIEVERRENIDINGKRYQIYDIIIDCGLPVKVKNFQPAEVGEYYHIHGFIVAMRPKIRGLKKRLNDRF